MEPIYFLWLMLAITVLAAATNAIIDVRRAVALRRLAVQWNMQFVLDDRFRLADRVGGRLPVIGAADVRARNLMYRTDATRRQYLFTVEFGVWSLSGQRRRRCVAALDEPATSQESSEGVLKVAPADLRVIEQYRRLHDAQILK
jgi:hypothetical protein